MFSENIFVCTSEEVSISAVSTISVIFTSSSTSVRLLVKSLLSISARLLLKLSLSSMMTSQSTESDFSLCDTFSEKKNQSAI